MILLRLLGIGAVYGLAFAFVKSLFPSPVILLTLVTGPSSEGNLTVLALVYMGVGLLAGLISAPIFGAILLLSRRLRGPNPDKPTGPRLTLSLLLSALMGVVSGILTLLAYGTGVLPTGGVLDPLSLIRASNFPTGTPLLVAWTIARDLLPAGLAGLFVSPFTGTMLVRLYRGGGAPAQKSYDEDL